MARNLVSLSFADQRLTTIRAALSTLETELAELVSIPAAQRRELFKMGDKSEVFCRETLSVLADKSGQSPLEEFIDSSAEVNRKDPSESRDKPLSADDYRAVFEQLHVFLTDPDRGMERLYKVIQGRDLNKAAN